MVRCRDGILTPVILTAITGDLLTFLFLLSILSNGDICILSLHITVGKQSTLTFEVELEKREE